MQAQLRTWGSMQEERLLDAPAETFLLQSELQSEITVRAGMNGAIETPQKRRKTGRP